MQMIQFQTYHNPYCGRWQRTRVRLETVNHTLSRERMKVPQQVTVVLMQLSPYWQVFTSSILSTATRRASCLPWRL